MADWTMTSPTQGQVTTSGNFTFEALVLITNEVCCSKCKSLSRYSQGVMLKLQSANKGDFIYLQPKNPVFEYDLPREFKTVQYHVDACEGCFKELPKQKKPQALFEHKGVKASKEELTALRLKAQNDALSRSNILAQNLAKARANGAKKQKKEKPVEPQISVLELF